MYPESRVFEGLYFVVMGWSNCFALWGGIRLFLMEVSQLFFTFPLTLFILVQ